MGGVFTLVHYVSVLIIVELGLRVNASCNAPSQPLGTHHNASLAVYQPGTVLYFTCDSGYHTNYNLPLASCLDSGVWNPPDLTCQPNTSSLIAAIVVTVVALSIFVVIVNLIRKKIRQRNDRSPKEERSRQFPDHPPETSEMSRPQPLYDYVKSDRRNTDITQDPTLQRGTSVALNGVSEIRDQADDASDGLENSGPFNNDVIDIINDGGLKMTGAPTPGSSRSHDYENIEIQRQGDGVRVHSYENTAIPNNKKLFN